MLSILYSFSDCISSFTILLQESRSDLSKTKVSVELIDGSVIFLHEIIIQNVLFDYSYHWQKRDNTLIIRWNNAAHYPAITTHPHHKQVGSETAVQPSYE